VARIAALVIGLLVWLPALLPSALPPGALARAEIQPAIPQTPAPPAITPSTASPKGPASANPSASLGPGTAIPEGARARYDQQKKSAPLALTLEALCPIAGAGGLYAGDQEKATVLAIVSAAAAAAGVGSAFWLVHLDGEHAGGGSRVALDVEQGTAISLLATAAVVYLVARISGLVLASEATASFNLDLQRRLGVPPDEPSLPFHAVAPGPALTLPF